MTAESQRPGFAPHDKISKIILGGMLINMCVESRLHELLEQGFEVAIAKDATAAPKHPVRERTKRGRFAYIRFYFLCCICDIVLLRIYS